MHEWKHHHTISRKKCYFSITVRKSTREISQNWKISAVKRYHGIFTSLPYLVLGWQTHIDMLGFYTVVVINFSFHTCTKDFTHLAMSQDPFENFDYLSVYLPIYILIKWLFNYITSIFFIFYFLINIFSFLESCYSASYISI